MRGLLPVMLFLGAIGTIAIVMVQAPDQPSGVAQVSVEIMAPNGSVWFAFEGTVAPAHALQALQQAAQESGIVIHIREVPGFGPCSAYVEGIGEHMESGGNGWVFATRDEEGQWQYPPMSANCAPLQDGDYLRWHWGTESS